ncbi:zinc-ribbon domain-containing protein [Archangium violaceum]|uniref:tetratricopeptide repeat protein n=1 Tax=Archangium violaceum TaxID=83451 RepID=UPI001952781B|nr:tetratricopeptide repeat protein [Archangium violaceum]QRN94002.1 zinc-ribbon domain-containing protein [Archangium violaceum]
MRITCQKCAAAYAIDDRVITPKGVRAQCPRCRHLQLVKREDAPAQPDVASAPVPKPAAAPVAKPSAPVAKPAAAPKPAAPVAKPAAAPSAAARPATPSASLTDELFGDLGDLEPAPDPNVDAADSLMDDLASIGSPPSPALSKDALFGDLADLTQSSPSNPTYPILESKPATPGYAIPSGDLLFDEIAPPPPPVAAPQPKPAAPVQARPAAPAPQPKPATPAFSVPSDDALFDFNSPPGFDAPPPAPQPKPAAPVQARPAAPQPKPAAPAPLPEPADDGIFDFNAPPGFSAPPSAQAAPALPEPADDGIFDFNAPPGFNTPPAAAAPAAAAAPEGDPLLDFFGTPPSQPQAAPAPARAQAPVAAPAATPKACRECGKSLVDPFDQALGACEDCRQRLQKSTAAPVSEVRSVEVLDLPPMSGDVSGSMPASLPPEPGSGARSSASAPMLSAEPRSSARAGAQRPVTAGVAVTASSGGRGGLVAALVVLLLLGGGGAAYMFVPQVKELVGGKSGGSGASSKQSSQPEGAPLPPAVEAVLPRWRLMFVDASGGDSKQLLSEGQTLLDKDQRLAYSRAAESFQRALLLDPRNDSAIGGYVQAISLGLGSGMDDTTFEEARSLIEAAEGRASRDANLLVAHANLLLARSRESENLEQARKLAEEVLAGSGEGVVAQKAEAHLVLGRVFLTSSRELANQHFDSALAIASDLHRVHYYRALADETAGDYPLAIDRLQKRLEQDPDHWETRSTLARIYLEVGETEKARQLYEARLKSSPGDFHALLAIAVMRYQVEGGVPGALGALRGLLRNRDKYEPGEVAELLLHLSAVERVSRNLEASAKAARESQELVKNNPAANLQLFLVSVARKDAAAAAGHLATLKGHLDDPALEKMLEGRLRLLERKPAEALAVLLESARLDPRRADAMLLAGVAAAQDGRRDEAFRVLAQVLQADPLRLAPRPVLTTFYMRSEDLLEGLEGSIVAIARGDDDLLPHLYEGLLRFHQGDNAAAEKMLKKVAEVDSNNAPSFAYRTLIAMERKDMKAAKNHAAHAVAGGRQVAIAHLVQGLVMIESKQVEPAKRSLREAVTLSPKLYAAAVKLAELEAATSRNDVRARLVRLLGLDPSYLPAKRVLYQLEKRG